MIAYLGVQWKLETLYFPLFPTGVILFFAMVALKGVSMSVVEKGKLTFGEFLKLAFGVSVFNFVVGLALLPRMLDMIAVDFNGVNVESVVERVMFYIAHLFVFSGMEIILVKRFSALNASKVSGCIFFLEPDRLQPFIFPNRLMR